jgi:cell division protein FtsN
MLFGLGIGLIVAVIVYLRTMPAGDLEAARARPAAALEPEPEPPAARREEPEREASASKREPAPESRFDFYDVLPQFEVVIPEVESEPHADTAARAVEEPGRYVLQVGSFRATGDAERMRARLALLGIESRVQRVTIDDDVFHRVRIGPIVELDELNEIRRTLRDARVESMLMKVPE